MKFFSKIFIFIILSFSLVGILNYLYCSDKVFCINPIKGGKDIVIRKDDRGSGDFMAPRSGHRLHKGIDILADIGTQVVAVKSGLAFPGEVKNGMGKYVKIYHPKGIVSIYGHLSKIYIKSYQKVKQGELIGEVGNTGNAKYKNIKPHLHFEIRIDGKSVDPFDDFLSQAFLSSSNL